MDIQWARNVSDSCIPLIINKNGDQGIIRITIGTELTKELRKKYGQNMFVRIGFDMEKGIIAMIFQSHESKGFRQISPYRETRLRASLSIKDQLKAERDDVTGAYYDFSFDPTVNMYIGSIRNRRRHLKVNQESGVYE